MFKKLLPLAMLVFVAACAEMHGGSCHKNHSAECACCKDAACPMCKGDAKGKMKHMQCPKPKH